VVFRAETASARPSGQAVLSLAFSPDGKILASGGFDRAVRMWQVGAGK
jgi:WD40 repeat protein